MFLFFSSLCLSSNVYWLHARLALTHTTHKSSPNLNSFSISFATVRICSWLLIFGAGAVVKMANGPFSIPFVLCDPCEWFRFRVYWFLCFCLLRLKQFQSNGRGIERNLTTHSNQKGKTTTRFTMSSPRWWHTNRFLAQPITQTLNNASTILVFVGCCNLSTRFSLFIFTLLRRLSCLERIKIDQMKTVHAVVLH